MYISMPADKLEELLQAAYVDGFEDGAAAGAEQGPKASSSEADWLESVTADQFDALKERVRNGGRV